MNKNNNKPNHTFCIRQILVGCIVLISMSACTNYLDVVPDNVATIDNAFTLRNEAEKYLFTCYSYLPKDGSPDWNIGYLAGDEVWCPEERGHPANWEIARGAQTSNAPKMNAWDEGMYNAIRDCNVFLENVSDNTKVLDLTPSERRRWLGEVTFLKAYYHFFLLRMYGPIVIVDKNLGMDASESDVRARRMPVDDCVNYIVKLLDEAIPNLPELILDRQNELGRITQPIALALKAQVLTLAASPLFNGNKDYRNFLNENGVPFFNQTYDNNKWLVAATAAKAAIDEAEKVGFKLFYFDPGSLTLSDRTITQMNIRNAVSDRWNDETIWADPNTNTIDLQARAMPIISGLKSVSSGNTQGELAPTFKMAEIFYTSNGVPINEDKTFDFTNKFSTRVAGANEKYNIQMGYETARLNFDRENRFYADMTFDGGLWFKYDCTTDDNSYTVQAKKGQLAGANHMNNYSTTGYYIKKVVNWNAAHNNETITHRNYPWPKIRLADIYLLYAEDLNEASGPSDDVFVYLDAIRKRAGLKGVKESWTNYSVNPNKFKTKEGLRSIIHQERSIEMCFEGSRFWDLRRWKEAAETLNENIVGWSISQSKTADYYQLTTVYQQTFVAPRDYLWPIKDNDLLINPNLIQNPGW